MSSEIYTKLSKVPDNALKVIEAGRLKGKSDINPQWRYEAMTQQFGLCGIGWKYTVVNKWTETDPNTNQVCAFVDVLLYVKVNDEWSDGIPGTGGSMLSTKERSGFHTSDEAYKMATTDALSTAMKMIGVAADVYRGMMDTKYAEPAPSTVQDDKPWLNKGTDDWTNVTNALKSGKASLQDVYKKFKVNKQLREELKGLQ